LTLQEDWISAFAGMTNLRDFLTFYESIEVNAGKLPQEVLQNDHKSGAKGGTATGSANDR
jgi:hypothetical protein